MFPNAPYNPPYIFPCVVALQSAMTRSVNCIAFSIRRACTVVAAIRLFVPAAPRNGPVAGLAGNTGRMLKSRATGQKPPTYVTLEHIRYSQERAKKNQKEVETTPSKLITIRGFDTEKAEVKALWSADAKECLTNYITSVFYHDVRSNAEAPRELYTALQAYLQNTVANNQQERDRVNTIFKNAVDAANSILDTSARALVMPASEKEQALLMLRNKINRIKYRGERLSGNHQLLKILKDHEKELLPEKTQSMGLTQVKDRGQGQASAASKQPAAASHAKGKEQQKPKPRIKPGSQDKVKRLEHILAAENLSAAEVFVRKQNNLKTLDLMSDACKSESLTATIRKQRARVAASARNK